MQEFLEESLTEQESLLLHPFITNSDRAVFGLRNLPEVVKGALFSRYSRSDKSLRRILLDEFIKAPEASFARIVSGGSDNGADQLVAIQQAEAFYDRVLIGYGDDSVAELGGAHLACEGISNIAAKALEDSRLGISPLEKSTRYVPFNRKINGRYRYYREPSIMTSSHAQRYEATLDHLFDTYTHLIEPLWSWVQKYTPQDTTTSERAYNNATKAKTLDLLRGLLPMATLTNVGLFGNGRAFEYLLVKLAASPHPEVRTLGASMQQELDQIIPSFVKRAKTERGAQYSRYLSTNWGRTQLLAQKHLGQIQPAASSTVQLVEYDPDAELKIVAAILYPHTNLTFGQIQEYVVGLSTQERVEIINTYVGDRESRFHRPGRAFEETYYTFDMLADIGAYRDLHRHRVLTQERQHYCVHHGYVVPTELEEANLDQTYRKALEYAAEITELISQDLPDAAQYVVPFAYRVRWRIKLNLREVYHLVELRSSRQGHPSYRTVAQQIYQQINAVHPTLVANMHFVDLNDYALERLAAEQRIDTKLQQLHQS
ncbi:FAD-dependent thymidylate synthase [Fischerella sp. JS2]|uniref:FAD-dependent thymidylate synthase n=1 Tax=Fischerella sp. JS2 TaxID=2597771 RepID=UPI0028EF5C8C|nr:FAD-dependent thymidylate synthase [Fischerella sp. JS2]